MNKKTDNKVNAIKIKSLFYLVDDLFKDEYLFGLENKLYNDSYYINKYSRVKANTELKCLEIDNQVSEDGNWEYFVVELIDYHKLVVTKIFNRIKGRYSKLIANTDYEKDAIQYSLIFDNSITEYEEKNCKSKLKEPFKNVINNEFEHLKNRFDKISKPHNLSNPIYFNFKSHIFHNQVQCKKFFTELRNSKLIDITTKETILKSVFSSVQLSEPVSNKIKWMGTLDELRHFLLLLQERCELNHIKKNGLKYMITQNCFELIKHPNYDFKKLANGQKLTTDKLSTLNKIFSIFPQKKTS